MASDEDEELDVLRSAVLASMKAKLRQTEKAAKTGSPAPEDDLEDDPELVALRTVALLSKNTEREQKRKEALLAKQQLQQQQFNQSNVYGPYMAPNYGQHFQQPPYGVPSQAPFQYGPGGQVYPPPPPQAPPQPMGFTKGNLFVIQPVELPKAPPNSRPAKPQPVENKPKELGRFSRFEGSDSEDEEDESFQVPAKSESEASTSSDESDVEQTTADDKTTQSEGSPKSNKSNKENESGNKSSSGSSDSSSRSCSRSASRSRSRSCSVSPRAEDITTTKSPLKTKTDKVSSKNNNLKVQSRKSPGKDLQDAKSIEQMKYRLPSPPRGDVKPSKQTRTEETADIKRTQGGSKSISKSQRVHKDQIEEFSFRKSESFKTNSRDKKAGDKISAASNETKVTQVKEQTATKSNSRKSTEAPTGDKLVKRHEKLTSKSDDVTDRNKTSNISNVMKSSSSKNQHERTRSRSKERKSSLERKVNERTKPQAKTPSKERRSPAEDTSSSKNRNTIKALPRGYKDERLQNRADRERESTRTKSSSRTHSHSQRTERENDRNDRKPSLKSPIKNKNDNKSRKRKLSVNKNTKRRELVHSSDSSLSDSSSASSESSDSDSDSGRNRNKSERNRDDIERDRRQREMAEREERRDKERREQERRERHRHSPDDANSRSRGRKPRKSSPLRSDFKRDKTREFSREKVNPVSERERLTSKDGLRGRDAKHNLKGRVSNPENPKTKLSSGANKDKKKAIPWDKISKVETGEKSVKRDREDILRELEKIDNKLKGKTRIISKESDSLQIENTPRESVKTEKRKIDTKRKEKPVEKVVEKPKSAETEEWTIRVAKPKSPVKEERTIRGEKPKSAAKEERAIRVEKPKSPVKEERTIRGEKPKSPVIEERTIRVEKPKSPVKEERTIRVEKSKSPVKEERTIRVEKPKDENFDDLLDSMSSDSESEPEVKEQKLRKRKLSGDKCDQEEVKADMETNGNNESEEVLRKISRTDADQPDPVISVTFKDEDGNSNRPSVHNRLGGTVQSKQSSKKSRSVNMDSASSGRRIIHVEDESGNSGDLRNLLSRRKITVDNATQDIEPERPKSVKERLNLGSKSHVLHRRDGQLGIKRRVHIERSPEPIELNKFEHREMKSRLDRDVTRDFDRSRSQIKRRIIRVDNDTYDARDYKDLDNPVIKASVKSAVQTEPSRASPLKKVKLKRNVSDKPKELKPEEKEKEMELDARIRKIKERNAAIEKRRRQIEDEKKRFA